MQSCFQNHLGKSFLVYIHYLLVLSRQTQQGSSTLQCNFLGLNFARVHCKTFLQGKFHNLPEPVQLLYFDSNLLGMQPDDLFQQGNSVQLGMEWRYPYLNVRTIDQLHKSCTLKDPTHYCKFQLHMALVSWSLPGTNGHVGIGYHRHLHLRPTPHVATMTR